MVYVDEIRKVPANAPRCFGRGYSHMTADTLEELHAMADKIGLRRQWFQNHTTPHYDLTPRRRKLAIDNGAIFKPALEQARERLRARMKKITIP